MLDRLAALAIMRGDLKAARAEEQQALTILRHIGDLHGQAVALATLSGLQARLGQEQAARTAAEDALQLARRLKDRRLEAELLTLQGESELRSGHADAGLRAVEQALALERASGDARGEVAALYLHARLLRSQGQSTQALTDLRAVVARLRDLYARLGGIPYETRQGFLAQFADLYRDYVDLLLEQYQQGARPTLLPTLLEEALQGMEEARSRSFTEMVNEAQAARALEGSGDAAFARLLGAERSARMELAALTQQRESLAGAAATDAPRASALRQQQARAEAAYREAQEALARRYPRYADLKNPAPLSLRALQDLLHPEEVLLAFAVTGQRTAVWAITADSARLAVLSQPRTDLAERVGRFHEALAAPGMVISTGASPTELARAFARFDPAEAYDLYRRLIAPVAPALAGKRRVYLVPDDVLYCLPFEALLTRAWQPESQAGSAALAHAPFWVLSQDLSYLPSASVLRSLRTLGKGGAVPPRPLLAFADPVFDAEATPQSARMESQGSRLRGLRAAGALRGASLPRLEETADEARSAATALQARQQDVYLRERASEYHVKHLPLRDYRYLLFATHGLLAGEFRPGVQPALALSFVGDPENDGLLEMGEVLGLDLHADLVVLSACNTVLAPNAQDRGEGFAGLTRSFMYAGARAVVVTLWSVASDTTRDLMSMVYRQLGQGQRALALAQAKRELITHASSVPLGDGHDVSTAHPFFWAPFILVGEGG